MVLVYYASNAFLDETIYGDYYTDYMAENEVSTLQSFITSNEVTTEDLSPLNEWCKDRYNRVTLFIADGDDIIFQSRHSGPKKIKTIDEMEAFATAELFYDVAILGEDVTFFEGEDDETTYEVYLYYHASYGYYVSTLILAAAVGCLVFAFVFFMLFRKKLSYIVRLKRELDILAGGDLSYEVTERGGDEIKDLATGINAMRTAIVERQDAEEEARRANAQLVTAMSHDLRSPLTAILGYLEMLKRHKYDNDEQLDYFVDNTYQKTLQIKEMSDKLFEYFLVSKSENEQIRMDEYDAPVLLMGMLEECILSLDCEGYTFDTKLEEVTGVVRANAQLLKRVFDNLYSNLKKYAEPKETIKVSMEMEEKMVLITMVNAAKSDISKEESTRIGLKTCERIIGYHDGTFTHENRDKKFTITMTLPLMD